MIPLQGFAPDLAPDTPGSIIACENMIPTLKGMRAAPRLTKINEIPGVGSGQFVGGNGGLNKFFICNDNTGYAGVILSLFPSITTKYIGLSGAWTDVTPVSGAELGGFMQFGFLVLAMSVNSIENKMHSSPLLNGTLGVFTPITTSPSAIYMLTSNNFVLAFYTIKNGDSVYYGDQWQCSDLGDPFTWIPAAGKQAADGRITDTPGNITGVCNWSDKIVVFKENSLYLMSYVGAPFVWSTQLISPTIGALDHSMVSTESEVYFYSGNDFYVYDGSYPRSIGAPVKDWFRNKLALLNRGFVGAYYDKFEKIVYWKYNILSEIINVFYEEFICYNTITGKWGRSKVPDNGLYQVYGMQFTKQGLPFANFNATPINSNPIAGQNLDNSPNVPIDSAYYYRRYETPVMAARDQSDGKVYLYTWNRAAADSSITVNQFGDDGNYSRLARVRPHFVRKPQSSTMTHKYKDELGVNDSIGETIAYDKDSGYDVLWEARYHSAKFDFVGDHEIAGITAEVVRQNK